MNDMDGVFLGYDRNVVAITLDELLSNLEKLSEIGRLGDEIASNYEIQRLVKKYECSADDAKKCVSLHYLNDISKGFDIESNYKNDIRLIEVKTAYDINSDVFFSINEFAVLKKSG